MRSSSSIDFMTTSPCFNCAKLLSSFAKYSALRFALWSSLYSCSEITTTFLFSFLDTTMVSPLNAKSKYFLIFYKFIFLSTANTNKLHCPIVYHQTWKWYIMEVYDIAASYFILLFYMVITLLFLQYIAKGKRQIRTH